MAQIILTGNIASMKAKKSLGQNFLTNQKAIQVMIESLEIKPGDTVVEIGPGKGALTKKLLESEAAQIIGIEKDDRMVSFLTAEHEEKIRGGSFLIHHEDFLSWQPSQAEYKLIGNIPFYITGAIIKHIFDNINPPTHLTLLVQKEVAERIVMRDGKNSILGTAVQIYCQPKILMTVKPGSFTPPPKVHSAIVSFTNIKNPFISKEDRLSFFEFLHALFAGKRKMITSNLKVLFPKEIVEKVLIDMDHAGTTRAEDLSAQEIMHLWTSLIHTREQ